MIVLLMSMSFVCWCCCYIGTAVDFLLSVTEVFHAYQLFTEIPLLNVSKAGGY